MRILFAIIMLIGGAIILAGFGSVVNTLFDLDISVEGAELPADWVSAAAFFVQCE
ncbi:MAG: hypothetical protein GY754_03250 [bacterium]|nr:hypothetical protein [bacterium]